MASCISRYKDTSFNVMEIWECEWDNQIQTNEAARDVQSEGEAAKDYKVEVMVGMSVSGMFTPSE